MNRRVVMLCAVIVALVGVVDLETLASPPADDRVSLKGIRRAEAVFDLRATDLDRLLFNLGLVEETWEGMKRQGVTPRFVVTVRGPAVRLFTRDGMTPDLAQQISALRKKGVRIEVCSVALRIAGVDTGDVVPDVAVVGNVLISQIALQKRGCPLVTLN